MGVAGETPRQYLEESGTMNTTTQTTTQTIAAHNLRPGMVASLPHYNHGEPTEIATAEAYGEHLTRLTFVDYDHTNTAYTMDRDQGVTIEAVRLEMWTVNSDGTPGDTYTMAFPTHMRRHDMLRILASYTLATHDFGRYYIRPSRNTIRINQSQGVAWLTDDVSRVAYFQN
jgi:hypothetical protein